MFWIVATVFLGIVGGIAAIVGFTASPEPKGSDALGARSSGALVAGGCLVAWVIVSVVTSIHTVGQRQVGLVYNFSGTLAGKKNPGVVMTWPWQHVRTENVGIQREDFSMGADNSAVSKDQQAIYANVSLNYQVEPAQVVSLYATVGPSWKKTLLDSRVLQDFKEVTSLYTAQQITTSRQQLRADTKQRLTAELARYDIKVVDVFVSNIGYSAAYRSAIDAKNVQVQRALQAQAKVAQATAEAEQTVATAQGQAKAIELTGRALRNNPDVLRLKAIEKLNPQATIVFCSSGSCPSFIPQALAGHR